MKILAAAFFLLGYNCALCQTNKEAIRKIDSIFASYNSQSPGAAVAIVKDGKVIFKKGYGMANLDHNIPITPQTVFNIASVSKQFTAFAIYLLEQEGKLSFEDNVRKYIPELPDYGSPIKIKHLLAHTSGLRDQAAMGSIAGYQLNTTEQILKLLYRQKSLNFAPGTMFNYNNTGYTLLAEIVQHISGKTFSAFTEEYIFKPLGMTSTLFYDNHEKIIKHKAESYEKLNNKYYHVTLSISNVGPSNLLTTVEDLSKWVLNFEKPIVGNKKLIDAFNEVSYLNDGTKTILRIANGDTIFHAKGQNSYLYKGVPVFSHGGHTAGFRTYMGRLPEQRLAIIQLSNDEHNEQLGGRWNIADYYIPQYLQTKKTTVAPPSNKTAEPPVIYSANLSDFAGEYYSNEMLTSYTFLVKENKLLMTHIRKSDLPLNRQGENKFSGSDSQTFAFELEFLRDEQNKVTAFSISNFGIKNLKFEKVK
jgi:CubicO group peptidase (beta-lactamase class C family)